MSVLFFIETANGKVKKNSFEAASYAAQVASKLGTDAVGIALGTANDVELANLGI